MSRTDLAVNIIVFLADEFEKFLENEKLRLLEQAQLDEENKGIDSVGGNVIDSVSKVNDANPPD